MNGNFRVGEFLIEPQLNTITGNEKTARVEPKVMQVLVCLAEHAGDVLPKEKLIQSVWADTFVTDDVLTRAISELRRVFADDPREPRFIQTIPRGGYRLVAAVSRDGEEPRVEPALTPADPVPSPPWGRMRTLISRAAPLLGVFITMAAIAYFIIRLNPRANPVQQPPQRPLSRLTFDPGLQIEPTWSPDARFIAYSSEGGGNFDIWVQPVGGGDAVQVTKAPANDWQPDWSPDGNRIVFRSEREGGGLYVVPALGGHEQKISSFGYRPRWSPDGSKVLFSDSWGGVTGTGVLGLEVKFYVADLDGSPPREVLADFMQGFKFVESFTWHPDGRRISVLGARVGEGTSLSTVPLAGGAPVKMGITGEGEVIQVDGVGGEFRWAPSGDAIYFQGTSQQVMNLWKWRVDPRTLRWVGAPERLTIGAGPDTDIALSPDGTRLAFTSRVEDVRIWSLPFEANAGKVKGGGQPVTAAGITPWNADLTRDGEKLSFIAWRVGTEKKELWEKSLKDGRETLLAVKDYPFFCPSWSRDGTRLAYLLPTWIVPGQPKVEPSTVILPAGGGDEQKLTSGQGEDGLPFDWSADGKWVLASSNRYRPGRWTLVLLPISAAPHAERELRVVASDPERSLFQGRFSPDDRWICFIAVGKGNSTIYVVPASGGEWTRITEEGGWADKPRWSPDGKTIYFVAKRGTGFLNVWGIRFEPQEGKPIGEPFQVTSYEGPGKMIWPIADRNSLSVSEHRLVLPIQEVTGSIWMLDGVDH